MRSAQHDGMALPTLNDLYETTGLGGAIGCSKNLGDVTAQSCVP